MTFLLFIKELLCHKPPETAFLHPLKNREPIPKAACKPPC